MIKNTRFTQKTLDYKSKLTHSENTLKLRCNATHRHCATHCKPETKETGDSSKGPAFTLCLFVQVSETPNRWPQWLRSGLTPNMLYCLS